jgi:hypothetical protein
MNILFQIALTADQHLPASLPTIERLINTAEQKQDMQIFLSRSALGRPLVAPPHLPSGRLHELQKAFMAMTTDKDFNKKAMQLNLDVDPIAGEDLHTLILDVYHMPKQNIERVKNELQTLSK